MDGKAPGACRCQWLALRWREHPTDSSSDLSLQAPKVFPAQARKGCSPSPGGLGPGKGLLPDAPYQSKLSHL